MTDSGIDPRAALGRAEGALSHGWQRLEELAAELGPHVRGQVDELVGELRAAAGAARTAAQPGGSYCFGFATPEDVARDAAWYAPATDQTDEQPRLGFAGAFRAVLDGHHIARRSWPEESYVTAQDGYPAGIGVNPNTAAATGLPEGSIAAFRPYLMRLIGTRGAVAVVRGERHQMPAVPTFAPWTPDQDDLFALDWMVWKVPPR